MTEKERYLELCEAAYDGRLIASDKHQTMPKGWSTNNPSIESLKSRSEWFDIAPETVTQHLYQYSDGEIHGYPTYVEGTLAAKYLGTHTFTLDQVEKPDE